MQLELSFRALQLAYLCLLGAFKFHSRLVEMGLSSLNWQHVPSVCRCADLQDHIHKIAAASIT